MSQSDSGSPLGLLPTPNPALKRLEKLVRTWHLKGRTLDAQQDNLTGGWRPGQSTESNAGNTYDATMVRM